VFAGVWITTGGTICNELSRYTGESVHTCMQQSANTDAKPVVIGFAKLSDIRDKDKIKDRSHSINTADQQVLCRSFVHVRRGCS